MSEADKLFKELGYKKETYNPDVIYFTNIYIYIQFIMLLTKTQKSFALLKIMKQEIYQFKN